MSSTTTHKLIVGVDYGTTFTGVSFVSSAHTANDVQVGVGEKCGSTYIDRNFHKWMSEKFGLSFDDLSFEKKGPGSRLMKGFEAEKRDFGTPGTLDKIFEVDLVMPNVPSSANYNAEDGTVLFTSADMRSFFDPVTLQILKLLQNQIIQSRTGRATQVKAVVLVGGFGDSQMLYQYLEDWCAKENLKLICEHNPQASVVKGAALRGLSTVRPDKRKSRLHYGILVSKPFRDGIDDEKDSYIHQWHGTKYCSQRMGWVIKKGQSFDQDEELPSLALHRTHHRDQKLTFTIGLYTCSEEQPSDSYDRDTCLHVGTIYYEFHGKDLSQFQNKRDEQNRKMWRLKYDLAFDLLAAKGILNFKILGPGKRSLGQTSIEYN